MAEQAYKINRLIEQTALGFSAIGRKEVRPRVKYQAIYMNREGYRISVMCCFLGVSRSGYYDYVKRLGQREHDVGLADMIRARQNKCDKTYSYRRTWK